MKHTAIVTDLEAKMCGVEVGSLRWAEKLTPLLKAKGIPEHKLFIGYVPFSMKRWDDVTEFEFGDISDHQPEVNRLES